MKQAIRTVSALALAAVLLLSMGFSALAAVTDDDLKSAVAGSAEYMLSTVKDPQVGSIGGEWALPGVVTMCRRSIGTVTMAQ